MDESSHNKKGQLKLSRRNPNYLRGVNPATLVVVATNGAIARRMCGRKEVVIYVLANEKSISTSISNAGTL